MCALILSRMYYSDPLLAGPLDTCLGQLKRLQYRVVRLIAINSTSPHEMLRTLHWLPIKALSDIKSSLMSCNAIKGNYPQYTTVPVASCSKVPKSK